MTAVMNRPATEPAATSTPTPRRSPLELSADELAQALRTECPGSNVVGSELCGLLHEAASRLRVLASDLARTREHLDAEHDRGRELEKQVASTRLALAAAEGTAAGAESRALELQSKLDLALEDAANLRADLSDARTQLEAQAEGAREELCLDATYDDWLEVMRVMFEAHGYTDLDRNHAAMVQMMLSDPEVHERQAVRMAEARFEAAAASASELASINASLVAQNAELQAKLRVILVEMDKAEMRIGEQRGFRADAEAERDRWAERVKEVEARNAAAVAALGGRLLLEQVQAVAGHALATVGDPEPVACQGGFFHHRMVVAENASLRAQVKSLTECARQLDQQLEIARKVADHG